MTDPGPITASMAAVTAEEAAPYITRELQRCSRERLQRLFIYLQEGSVDSRFQSTSFHGILELVEDDSETTLIIKRFCAPIIRGVTILHNNAEIARLTEWVGEALVQNSLAIISESMPEEDEGLALGV
ncbi:hypothetical protein KW790_00655 [Candidatus Parcubacteria bacterium]|nr:hypothetical protein [Candidatus Parcubacteria bacterium]